MISLFILKKCWAEVLAEPVLGICELSPKWWVHKWIISYCHLTCQSQTHKTWNLLSRRKRGKVEVQMPRYDQAIRTIYFSQSKSTLFLQYISTLLLLVPSSNMNTAVSGGLRITQFGSFNYIFRRQMGCEIPGHQLWENLQSHTIFSATGINLGLPHLHVLSLEMQKEPCHEHFTSKER